MKTIINITGQISGNFKLKSAIASKAFCEVKQGMFNSFNLTFATKKEAIGAIRAAYKSLVADDPESKNKFGGVRVNSSRTELYYDASSAIIANN